jgi:GNAT superfamily N-acetyltransferase
MWGNARLSWMPMPPSDALVRRARDADLPRIVELLINGSVPGETSPEGGDIALYRSALQEIGGGAGAVLVAELADEVVGVCQLIVFRHLHRRGGLCAEIESVHVHPDHRGAGIGSTLLAHAIGRARALGCYRVQLTSNRAREDAHRFYERLGFVPSHVGYKLFLS